MRADFKKFVILIIIVLSALFFYRAFTGDSIQGNSVVSDSPLGITRHYSRFIGNTTGNWIDYELLGHPQGNIQINLYTLYSYLLPVGMVLAASYFSALLFSFIFGYLLLRKLKLEFIPSLFGSAAFAFSPTVLSFIYAGHTQVVCSLSYIPAIFYFLACAFDSGEKNFFKITLTLFLSGVLLGIMCSDEAQRGLYFGILAACFVLYRIFEKNRIALNNLKGSDLRGAGLDITKALLIPVIFLLVVFSGSKFLLQALKGRIALQTSSEQTSQASEDAWNFAVSYSLHPFELIDSLAFGFHGKSSMDPAEPYWGSKGFSSSCDTIGFFVVFFALLGAIAFYKKNGIVRFFVFGGIISLLLSFGRFWPGYPFFYLFYHLPYMSNFRDPVKLLCVTAFCLSVLSGYGLKYIMDLLAQKTEEARKSLGILEKALIISFCAGILSLVIALLASNDTAAAFSSQYNDSVKGQAIANNIVLSLLRMDVFLAITLALAAASFRIKKLSEVSKAAIIPSAFFVMLIVDLWTIDLYYVDKSYIKLNEFYTKDGPVAFLNDEGKKEPFRVITSLMLPGRGGMLNIPVTSVRGLYLTFYYSFFDIQAMEKVASSDVDVEINNFFNSAAARADIKEIKTLDDLLIMNLPVLRFTGIKYLVTDGLLYGGRSPLDLFDSLTNNTNFSLSLIAEGYEGRREAVFEVKSCFPRLSLFGNFVNIDNNGEALRYLADPKYDYMSSAIVNGAPPASVSGVKGRFIMQKTVSYKDWDIKTDIEAPDPSGGFLLNNTRYDAGWKAYIDGKPARVYKADYLLMGVFVGGGKHSVEFRYEPDPSSFMISFITVIAGLAGALLYGFYMLFFKKRQINRI